MELITNALTILKGNKDAFQAGYYIAVAVFGLFGLYFVYQRNKALQTSSRASEVQAEVAKANQINDQYIKSIEQLGSDTIAVTLGGIYGLENVAHSSPDFRRQVIETLTAYVREHASKPEEENLNAYGPRKDIQAILTVLGRMDNKGLVVFDLSDAFLRDYTFEGDFTGASFENANFTQASCEEANFNRAMCSGANFTMANCSNTNFTQASCGDANFTEANCGGSDFSEAVCIRANFARAEISFTKFISAQCSNANFSETYVWESNFAKANIIEADFTDAKLQDTNFTGADPSKAIGLIIPKKTRL